MSSPAGLIRSALETPGDDAPRLVLADWLEENGQTPAERARAEFIRVQCELARWVPDLDRRDELQARERALLEAHREAWLGGPRAPWRTAVFHRGMARVGIEKRRLATRVFTAPRNDWLNRAFVEALRPVNFRIYTSGISGAPGLEGVAELDLSGFALTDEGVRPLLESPHLGGLVALDLSNNGLTEATVLELVARAEQWPGLVRLDLRNNRIDGAAVQGLLDSPLGARLRWLELHGNEYDPGALAQWRDGRPAPSPAAPVRLINSLGMELARLPAGSFRMGSPDDEPDRFDNEGPQHRVKISRPFWIGLYPVTQGQYEAVLGENPSALAAGEWRRQDFPADNINWDNAAEFCRRLGATPAERKAGRSYRLPSEAEWEYACRAGTTTPFHFGTACGGAECNFGTNETYGGARRVGATNRTTRVGSYGANAFGLYDFHGNIQEWVADWYSAYKSTTRTDPTGPRSGEMRVLRGGSWFVNATRCRSARRNRYYGESANDNYGFRVVMTERG